MYVVSPKVPPDPRMSPPSAFARTRIIVTVGPACDAPAALRRMIDAGASIFRLNFSHGTLDQHAQRLAAIRAAAAELGRTIAVLGDLCGPKIRVSRLPAPVELVAGQSVVVTSTPEAASGTGDAILPSTYAPLPREVEPGHRVLINDGAVRLLAVASEPVGLRCQVLVGGQVTSGKGINLPDSRLSAPAITDRDWECVEWAVAHDLDFLALSFVRHADEVRLLKARVDSMCPVSRGDRDAGLGSCIPVIAKIEKPQALKELDGIIDAADAIMVARGDLGVEMDLPQVPVVQKHIVARCAEWGKPCIVATQMLESMTERATPTRAEVSDVANAVFDGADAVMLSGETAVGAHPVLVVETMRRVILAAEARIAEGPQVDSAPARLVETRYRTAALAHGAWYVARDLGAPVIACWSQHGGTARYLSQNNFRIPIVAYSSSPRATRRMTLLAGVLPILAEPPASARLADWTDLVERDLARLGLAERGDHVVLLAGEPLGTAKATGAITVRAVGE